MLLARILLLLFCLTPSAVAQTVYPCDISPAPVLCWGNAKLVSTYTGHAMDVFAHNPDRSQTIDFLGDALDTAALDTFLDDDVGIVTRWYGQKNSIPLDQVVDQAPSIGDLSVGNARAIIFQGESQSGALNGMVAGDFSGIGLTVTAKDYTVTLVLRPSSSVYANQAAGSDINLGAVFDLISTAPVTLNGAITSASPIVTGISSTTGLLAGDVIGASGVQLPFLAAIQSVDSATQITMTVNANTGSGTVTPLTFARPVARAYNNANAAASVYGTWSVGDGGAFNFIPESAWVQMNPTVLSITSDSTGVKLWQNGQIRATASRSALTRTAAYMYLGRLANSVAGAYGRSTGIHVVGAMVHDVGLTQVQQATLSASLWAHFAIDPTVSEFSTNLIALFGDSIPAGYVTLGIYSYLNYLLDTISLPARGYNFAVPGSTCSQNPAGGPAYANTTGLFPLAGAPVLPATNANKGRVAIFHLGGNDSFGPTQRAGTTHTSTLVDGISDTSDLTVGDYVFASNLPTLVTIISKTANSITLSGAATSSTTLTLQFLYAATSPTMVYNCIQALVTAASVAGSTKNIVSTILPRTQGLETWNQALNVLINAGVTGATVVDCAAYPGLNTIPGPSYADSAHLTALGQQQMAACLLSAVNSGLQNFLLKRDLGLPGAANDNTPMWLNKAA